MSGYAAHPGASGDMPLCHVWTDGSNYQDIGGWAAVLRFGEQEKEISGSVRSPDMTNNRMEMTAALEALWVCKHPTRFVIHTDSKYMADGWTMHLPGWVRRGWVTAGDKPKPIANQDLWRAFLVAARCHSFQFRHVKGHNGDELNERCDRLANEARKAALDLPTRDQEAKAREVAARMVGAHV